MRSRTVFDWDRKTKLGLFQRRLVQRWHDNKNLCSFLETIGSSQHKRLSVFEVLMILRRSTVVGVGPSFVFAEEAIAVGIVG